MTTTAIRSSDFSNSIGVNTHLSDTLGPYGNLARVKSQLDYVGVTAVRDSNAFDWSVGNYAALARLGVKLDLVVTHNPGRELGNGGIQAELAVTDRLETLAPGSIIALEGQNEPYTFVDTFNGRPTTDWSTVVQVQNATNAAVQADASVAGIQLLSPSVDPWSFSGVAPSFAGSAAIGNAHVYPYAGNQPRSFVAAGLAGQQVLLAGRPSWITEFGYSNTPGDASYGVDGATQAKNTINGLLDAFQLGAIKTFLYELDDENTAIAPNTPWGALGLFNADGSAKPVAVALHNLSVILADKAAGSSTFAPGALDFTVSGLPGTAFQLLLQKSSGVFDLVLWNEASDWDASTQSEITAAAVGVTVSAPSHWATATVYDPLTSAMPVAAYSDVGSVHLSLTDHAVVVEIVLAPAAAASVPPGPVATTVPVTNPIAAVAVYRFFDSATGTHFFTSDPTEAASIVTPTLPGYNPRLIPEQNGYGALTAEQARSDPAAVSVYRLFDTSNGTHFFTADQNELAILTTPASISYRPDLLLEKASTFYEHATMMPGDVAVYRFFDTQYGTHFYTADVAEYQRIGTAGSAGYRHDLKPEGISFYAPAGAYTA